MPVFEYKCSSCGAKYDIFHFTKEVAEDIVCPKCQSKEYEKLFSTFSANMNGAQTSTESPCTSCCSGGSCGLNY